MRPPTPEQVEDARREMHGDCLSGSRWCFNNGASGRDAELCGACQERDDSTHDGRHDRCRECGTEDGDE